MKFQKGVSGNPKGRPRLADSAREMFAKLGGKDGKVYAEQLHNLAAGQHGDVHARLKALAIIAPYLWGKPTEHVEMTQPEGVNITHRFVVEAK